jgi:hypothetical protein
MNIQSGTTRVTIPPEHVVHSEVLKTMDPHEDVDVPEFVGKYLDDVASILKYLTTHGETIDSLSPKDPHLVYMCVQCVPSLQNPYPHDQFKQSLEILKVVQFLDIPLCVRLMFCFIFHTVGTCSTIDDIVNLLFYPGEFEQLSLDEQKKSYELLLDNIGNFKRF